MVRFRHAKQELLAFCRASLPFVEVEEPARKGLSADRIAPIVTAPFAGILAGIHPDSSRKKIT